MIKTHLRPAVSLYKLSRAFLAGVCVLILPSFACSQEAEEETIIMNMPDLDIRSLIQWAVDTLDKNIVVHRSVQGNVTILAEGPMTRGEAWEVFLSAMQINGYIVVETGNVTRIIPDTEGIQTNIPLIDDAANANSSEMIIKLVEVENISAAQLVTLLRPLVPQIGYLASYDEGNTLIIADYANNLSRIENIIESIDQAGALDVEMITLENANAIQVINILNTLMVSSSTDPAATVGKVSFAVDERSNSILMSGDVAKRQQMRALIAGLDQPIADAGNTHVIYVHYMVANDLIPIVQSVVESVQAEQRNEAAPGNNISIVASEAANAIIITAPPPVMDVVRSVISRLDIRRAQVLVEAIIVEVNQDKIDELGVLWSTNPDSIGERGVVGIASTIPSTLTDGLDSTGGMPNMSLLGNGLTLGYYRSGTLRAMLRALETDTAANILSTPSIVTLDNEEAEIIVGSNVPFLTGSRETLGSSSLFNTIERRDIGITLNIKPQINEGDSITLDISQTVESVTDRDQAADIQTDKREITTKVIVYDNDILVLGGLIKDGVTESEQRIPILGDIPIAGRLFQSRRSNNEKKNLMVFIHATILKDQISENSVSLERYNRIRDQQLRFEEDLNEFRSNNMKEGTVLPEYELYRQGAEPVPAE